VPAGGNNGLLAGQMVDENPSAGSEGDAEPSLKRLPTDYRDQVPARQGCHGPQVSCFVMS
jgi:hypothetical protein